MSYEFAVVGVFLLAAFAIVGGALVAGRFLRPSIPDPTKSQTYECGERPIGSGWFNFNPRFYQLALLFLVFDVDVALTWPVVAVAKRWVGQGNGWVAVLEITLFVAILVAALAFLWGRGDLDWVREIGVMQAAEPEPASVERLDPGLRRDDGTVQAEDARNP
jgi:NADH-quinone oxidoreductase subunit A